MRVEGAENFWVEWAGKANMTMEEFEIFVEMLAVHESSIVGDERRSAQMSKRRMKICQKRGQRQSQSKGQSKSKRSEQEEESR